MWRKCSVKKCSEFINKFPTFKRFTGKTEIVRRYLKENYSLVSDLQTHCRFYFYLHRQKRLQTYSLSTSFAAATVTPQWIFANRCLSHRLWLKRDVWRLSFRPCFLATLNADMVHEERDTKAHVEHKQEGHAHQHLTLVHFYWAIITCSFGPNAVVAFSPTLHKCIITQISLAVSETILSVLFV